MGVWSLPISYPFLFQMLPLFLSLLSSTLKFTRAIVLGSDHFLTQALATLFTRFSSFDLIICSTNATFCTWHVHIYMNVPFFSVLDPYFHFLSFVCIVILINQLISSNYLRRRNELVAVYSIVFFISACIFHCYTLISQLIGQPKSKTN